MGDMNHRKERKSQLQEALNKATGAHTITYIAEDSGLPVQRLYDFRQKGYMNPDDEDRLRVWLARHGYLDAPISHPDPKTPLEEVADELFLLAAYLRSDNWTDADKLLKLDGVIVRLYKNLKSIRDSAVRFKKRGD